jgi:uncharacterized Fe-S cluster-containing radical SAM superfamily protein
MNDSIKILDIFYGNKCQLACAHCDTRSDYIRHGEFDPTLDNILESVTLASQQFNVDCWSVLGGEPFLYTDTVIAIIEHIRSLEKEKDKVIFFPTNGIALNKPKVMDLAVELITKHNVWMQICSHVAAWDVLAKHNQMLENVYDLADRVGYDKVEPTNSWWSAIMNLGGGNAAWQEFNKRKGMDITMEESPNEAAWMNGKSGIYYMEAHSFQKIHNRNELGKLKPFNQGDPESSYWQGCPSCFCAMLINKKVYKCGALGTLKNVLTKTNQLDDEDWQPYLNYKPVDLTLNDQESINNFYNTHYSHIDACNMCPKNINQVKQNEQNVLPKYAKNRL